MPIEIQRLTSEINVASDEMPVSDALVERIAGRVEELLRRRERAARSREAATSIRDRATPPAVRSRGAGA